MESSTQRIAAEMKRFKLTAGGTFLLCLFAVSCQRNEEPASSNDHKDQSKKEIETPILTYTAIDGSAIQPLVFKEGIKAKVFIFSTIDCPVANGYSPEISRLAKVYKDRGVSFHLIHVDPDTDLAKAKKHAQEYSLSLPILLDPKHELVAFTKAEITPEAAIVTPDKKIPYRGRIDNLYADYGKKRRQVTVKDLELALEAVLKGESVAVARTEVIGCIIADFKK